MILLIIGAVILLVTYAVYKIAQRRKTTHPIVTFILAVGTILGFMSGIILLVIGGIILII